jgi:phosphopantothenoylcysteine decarboxylase/phosphopantothenate--cysteine ligase
MAINIYSSSFKMALNKRIILGITGSVAASKCPELIMKLKNEGADLRIVLTKSAEHFVNIDILSKIIATEHVFYADDLFSKNDMLHIELAKFADLILIAPASANFIAKISAGLADDLLSTICLASAAEIILAPAMNQQMWHNKFTQQNIKNLSVNGVSFIGPNNGLQACGDVGYGRMSEPDEIVETIASLNKVTKLFSGKRILISAGPTIEQIDSVRYISNYSSGKMGWALAEAAYLMGADVTLVSGPVSLDPIPGVKVIFVKSAQQMFEQVYSSAKCHDIFISAAAVADYKPTRTYNNKIKKTSENINIELEPTIDILKEVTSLNLPLFTVGFAAETNDVLSHAYNKIDSKKLDMIVANDVSEGRVFGSDYNQVSILAKEGGQEPINIGPLPKKEIAVKILQAVAEKFLID